MSENASPNSPAKKATAKSKGFLERMFFSAGRRNPKSEAVTIQKASSNDSAPAAAPGKAPCFFTVVHTFVEGKAEAWWSAISSMGEKEWAAMAEKHHALGFHNHSFLPTSTTGVINCLWECQAETTAEQFQAFIDGPDGPGEGVFVNQAYRVMDGGVLPTSFFHDSAPAPAMPTTGTFFWVHHTFKEGAAAGFWEMLRGMEPADFAAMAEKNHALGLHNHSFAPCAVEGPCVCIWESNEPMTAESFQRFIDGPDGPGAGAVFDNAVHAAMEGAALPPAYFQQPSVVQHRINTIPIVAGSMPKIVQVARSDEFKATVGGFAGLLGVDVLAVDDSTMVSHSRWESAAYAKAAAAALGSVLGGALKEFVAGPPSPIFGHAAWSVVGGSSRGRAVDAAVRLTSMSLKEGAFDAMMADVAALEGRFKPLAGLVRADALKTGPDSLLVAAEYESMTALDAATPAIREVMAEMATHLAATPDARAGTCVWSFGAPTLQQANLQRVQQLVAEFQAGRPEGYMEGVADDIKGSILGGLIPGADRVSGKAEFGALMGKMEEYMEVQKFEPCLWRAVGDDVLFNVEWKFVWKESGEAVETTALVRKVVRNGLICEKYHMIDAELITKLTGNAAPHSPKPVERVQALLAEYGAGNPEGYLAGVADDIKADVLGGLIPGADRVSSKAEFGALMGKMEEYMEVQKFEPCLFRALPNNDMMFNVRWAFLWKPTGQTVETTAVVRKVLKEVDGALQICEKYHMVDASCVEA